MSLGRVHIIGFGGQGRAIAPSLLEAGMQATVYLRSSSSSFHKCAAANIPTLLLSDLPSQVQDQDLIIFACPDRMIGEIYSSYFAELPQVLHFVLLHGYAMWSKELTPAPHHTVNLCAPKAIGPELRAAIIKVRSEDLAAHSLKAAYFAQNADAATHVQEYALNGMNFARENLIPATFEQETVGDLISEQLLLCGGLFSLMEWTIQEMRKAQIPDALIREECITELGLIANVLKNRGLEETVATISDSAKAGAVMMREKFIAAGLPKILTEQANEVTNGVFLSKLKNEKKWKDDLSRAFKENSV